MAIPVVVSRYLACCNKFILCLVVENFLTYVILQICDENPGRGPAIVSYVYIEVFLSTAECPDVSEFDIRKQWVLQLHDEHRLANQGNFGKLDSIFLQSTHTYNFPFQSTTTKLWAAPT